ncbi:MAG: ATP-binding protein [Calditrichaeota bacterium]|nr:MAG: ATP-binding protein [Calditrichota bacterium]MBL1206382.1 ATP-binding protein [Calditrichota bacterium]NOG46208.1 ATP-binding protein [Calditrichota bacterium]
MNLIDRAIKKKIINYLKPNKVVVILGARRVGKTILIKQLIEKFNEPFLLYNGEDRNVAEILKTISIQNYKNILDGKKLLIIDEAQKIKQIGEIIKLMIDEISGLKVILSGSSAFDLSNTIGEPLTGRKTTFHLFPLSEREISETEEIIQRRDNLRERLVFGNYPELLHSAGKSEKTEYLQEIINSYLLKDILIFDGIKNSDKLFNLLKLIAYQTGSLVSHQELGKQLGMSKTTVERYLDLLAKVFIIHKVGGFSKNLRKEVVKNSKWYFYDNGIRNALIANLNPVELRNDIGLLWENYMVSERIKQQSYNRYLVNNYFWRTYDKQEIDWVEEREGTEFAYEFKWKQQKTKIPVAWKKAYPKSIFSTITSENYLEWLK